MKEPDVNDPLSVEQLQGHFEIPGVVEFDRGRDRLARVRIRTELAEAAIYLHGAHVAHFQPRGQAPVLFMSRRSMFEAGQPIRGGVPVIFPWFGQRSDGGEGPPHGLARLRNWGVEAVEQQSGGEVAVTFALTADEATRRIWEPDFVLRYTVTVGRQLAMSLRVSNAGESPFRFEAALHSYFQVGDIRQVRVEGLENTGYVDKTHGFQLWQQGPEPLTFCGETDRVYQNTRNTCVIDDPAMRRRIAVSKQGSDTTVVWNPWIDKARDLPDFADQEWREMVCIETANTGDHAISLPPGAEHEMTAEVAVAERQRA